MKAFGIVNTLFTFILIFTALSCFGQSNSRGEELKGKRIGVIGDSYVRNHKEPVEYTWHYKFAQKYSMEYLNYGRNGSCIGFSRARFGEAVYLRYSSMADSLDYVLVIAGHNDSAMLDSMGGIGGFREKLSVLCEGLLNKYPTAKIFFFTRWVCNDFAGSDSERVVDAMIEVCGNYGIPILDCARSGGVYAYSEPFRRAYFQSPTDTAHLNAAGHDRFLPFAEEFLLRY